MIVLVFAFYHNIQWNVDSLLINLVFLSINILSLPLSLPQSLGLLIGATVTNVSLALTVAVLLVISSMLVAGFFVETLPAWMAWTKTISFVSYAYDAFLRLEFTVDSRFR